MEEKKREIIKLEWQISVWNWGVHDEFSIEINLVLKINVFEGVWTPIG